LNDDIFCFWKVCHISFNNWQICVCYFRSGIICIPWSANDTPLLCPAISFRVWNLSAINTWWSAYTFTPISGLCSINQQNLLIWFVKTVNDYAIKWCWPTIQTWRLSVYQRKHAPVRSYIKIMIS
jgi:hypothetical protein